MSYLVIARKYRPMLFDDVIGQEHITTTLKNAIESKRIAHAYIFSGPRGVGKTTSARIFAKAINCENGGPTTTPCNTCLNCTEITGGRSLDVLEIDGASNRGIDEIRSLRDNVRYMPVRGGYKVYIIDEFHMITKDAFNALLKTLEEPPPQVIFIFATTEPHKILPTILSRCQCFDFKRVSIEKIVARLQYICDTEKIVVDAESLFAIAHMADGGMRDALTLLDQVISFCGTNVGIDQVRQALGLINLNTYFELTEIIKKKNTADGFTFTGKVLDAGWDITEFLHGFLEHIRNMLMAKACGVKALTDVFESHRTQYAKACEQVTEADLLRMMQLISETIQRIKWSVKPKFIFELLLMKLIQMENAVALSDLIRKIESIENSVGNGASSEAVKKKPNLEEKSVSPQRAAGMEAAPVNPIPTNNAKSFVSSAKDAVTLEQVQAQWSAIVERVKTEKRRIGAILEHCVPVDVKPDAVHVGFIGTEMNEFHAEIIHKEKDYLSIVMKDTIGQRLRIQCDMGKKMAAPVSADGVSEKTSEDLFDKYPTVDAGEKQENGDATELFKYVRQLQEQNPLKKVIELLDAELVDVSFKH
jgi:DNA polymerase-3 subunit gamma/tau